MKLRLLSLVFLGLVGLVSGHPRECERCSAPKAHRITHVVGAAVLVQDTDYGKVVDVVVNRFGFVQLIVVEAGDRYVVVPWRVARVNWTKRTVAVDVKASRLRVVSFTGSQWPDFYSSEWRGKIRSVYGRKLRRESRETFDKDVKPSQNTKPSQDVPPPAPPPFKPEKETKEPERIAPPKDPGKEPERKEPGKGVILTTSMPAGMLAGTSAVMTTTAGLFAQAASRSSFYGWSLAEILILVVVLAACIALVYVALNQFGVGIPEWVKQVFWIVVVAFVVIVAIRFVLSM